MQLSAYFTLTKLNYSTVDQSAGAVEYTDCTSAEG